MKRTSRLALIAGTAAALVIGLGSPASAGTDQKITVSGGQVWFESDGDELTCFDAKSDGRGIRAEIRNPGGSGTSVHCKGHGVLKSTSKDFDEGTLLDLRVCYTLRDESVRCSGWQHAMA